MKINYVLTDQAGKIAGSGFGEEEGVQLRALRDNLIVHDIPEGFNITKHTHIINNLPITRKVELTESQLITSVSLAVQAHLDSTARTHNYDSMLSLCTYATSLDPVFAAEAQAGVEWRDACWRQCYKILADVKAGKIVAPTAEELLMALPVISWPI